MYLHCLHSYKILSNGHFDCSISFSMFTETPQKKRLISKRLESLSILGKKSNLTILTKRCKIIKIRVEDYGLFNHNNEYVKLII